MIERGNETEMKERKVERLLKKTSHVLLLLLFFVLRSIGLFSLE